VEEEIAVRARTTLILLILFAAALAYVLLVERRTPTREEREEEEKALFDLTPRDIRGLRIESGGATVAIERSDSTNWAVTAPVSDRAENTAVESIIEQLKSLKAERVFDPEEGPAAFGLAPPSLTVRLSIGAAERTLEVGDKTPTSDGYFARVDGGSRIAVIPSYVVEGQLRKSLTDLRDKRLADFPLERVRRIRLEGSGPAIDAARETGDGPWRIVAPGMYEADAAAVNSLVNRFRYLRARDFVDRAVGTEFGFESPPARLLVTLDDGTMHELTLGREEDDQVFARVSGRATVYKVPATTRTDLTKTVQDLREKRIMKFEPNDAVLLTIALGDTTLVAEKDSAGVWRFTDEPGRPLVKWRIEDPIRNLSLVRAESFVEPPKPPAVTGLARPKLVATVTLKDGSEHSCSVGAAAGDRFYAAGEVGPGVVLIQPTTWNQMSGIVRNRPYESGTP
jgi:hypothetical protein